MKRTKLLALTLVVAIMMVGAGYAAWTDTLHINNTINTGHLDVHFIDTANEVTFGVANDGFMDGSASYALDYEGGQNEYDTANVTINKVYPGATFKVELTMKNNSTMPVKLSSLPFGDWADWAEVGLSSSGLVLEYLNENGDIVETFNDNPFDPGQWGAPGRIVPVNGFIRMYLIFVGGENILEDTPYTLAFTPIFEQFNK